MNNPDQNTLNPGLSEKLESMQFANQVVLRESQAARSVSEPPQTLASATSPQGLSETNKKAPFLEFLMRG